MTFTGLLLFRLGVFIYLFLLFFYLFFASASVMSETVDGVTERTERTERHDNASRAGNSGSPSTIYFIAPQAKIEARDNLSLDWQGLLLSLPGIRAAIRRQRDYVISRTGANVRLSYEPLLQGLVSYLSLGGTYPRIANAKGKRWLESQVLTISAYQAQVGVVLRDLHRLNKNSSSSSSYHLDLDILSRKAEDILLDWWHYLSSGDILTSNFFIIEWYDYVCNFCRRALVKKSKLLSISERPTVMIMVDMPLINQLSNFAAFYNREVYLSTSALWWDYHICAFSSRHISDIEQCFDKTLNFESGSILGFSRQLEVTSDNDTQIRSTYKDNILLASSFGARGTPSYLFNFKKLFTGSLILDSLLK